MAGEFWKFLVAFGAGIAVGYFLCQLFQGAYTYHTEITRDEMGRPIVIMEMYRPRYALKGG